MKRILLALVLLALSSAPVYAWDGPRMWHEPADAASPGGGGVFGVGGARDHRITCLDCHVERAVGDIKLDFAFDPPLASVAGAMTYQPGQRYKVDVAMLGEFLGPPCDQYMTHVNNFAARFETTAGDSAGILESDSGQSQTSCPTDYPDPQTGTTALYRDCEVIFSRGLEDTTKWTFYWNAPANGGTVRMNYGGVDGDCMMDSLGDAVVVGDMTLSSAVASKRSKAARREWGHPVLAFLPFALVFVRNPRRRKQRRPA